MNDDLISREYLKRNWTGIDTPVGYRKVVDLEVIDNAPTVESDKELYEKIETYKNAYRIMSDAFENEVRKNKRPHGEWIIDGHHYKCSRCGKTLAIMFSETDDDDLIGCPFCLADMRGENHETDN